MRRIIGLLGNKNQTEIQVWNESDSGLKEDFVNPEDINMLEYSRIKFKWLKDKSFEATQNYDKEIFKEINEKGFQFSVQEPINIDDALLFHSYIEKVNVCTIYVFEERIVIELNPPNREEFSFIWFTVPHSTYQKYLRAPKLNSMNLFSSSEDE